MFKDSSLCSHCSSQWWLFAVVWSALSPVRRRVVSLVLFRRVGKRVIDQVLGFWDKMETIALELAVENSFMKGTIKELESTDRKTYAGVVGGARSERDSKEVLL